MTRLNGQPVRLRPTPVPQPNPAANQPPYWSGPGQTGLDQVGTDRANRSGATLDWSGPGHHPGPVRTGSPRWPVTLSLLAIVVVFTGGAVWSFREQTALAEAGGFHLPQLLPVVIDGFAIAMAAVAWSASLDGRTAGFARLGILAGISCSAAVNGAWAYARVGTQPLTVTVTDTTVLLEPAVVVALAAGVPVLANASFEVLLAEVRRQVLARRGTPQPQPVPAPRLVRLLLAPWPAFREWRQMVLAVTAPDHRPGPVRSAGARVEPHQAGPAVQPHPVQTEHPQTGPVQRPAAVQPDQTSGLHRPGVDRTGLTDQRTGPAPTAPRTATDWTTIPDQTGPVMQTGLADRAIPDQTGGPHWIAATARTAPAAQTGPDHTRQADQQTTGRAGPDRTGPSRTALADATTLVRRYGPGCVPGRNQVRRDMGWGAGKASAAIKAIPHLTEVS